MDPLLRGLDLNLLRVLAALHRTRSVTAAADMLDLSQSTVSNALARLRRACDDELFLRTPRGMAPTPYCDRLAHPVAAALARVAESLSERSAFDPARTARRFTLRMTDIGEIVFLPGLLARFARLAPAATLRTVSLSSGDTALALANADVDLAIGFLPELKKGWYQQRLFEQRYVVLARRAPNRASAARARRAMSRSRYLEAEHLVIESPGTGHLVVEQALERLGVQRRVKLRVPDFLAAVLLAATSDLVCTVPEKLAAAVSPLLPLETYVHPFALPRFTILQYWHPRVHRDPANQWLRQLVAHEFHEPALGETR